MHGLVRSTHWVQVFTRARGGCDNHRCHNKNPRWKIGPGTWMTSCPEAEDYGIWKKTVSWDLNSERVSWDSSLEEGSRFLVSPRRDQLGSTKHAARLLKKLHLSLLMSKNLKLKKVIKSFVPEPFSCFSDFYVYEHLWTFSVSVWIGLFGPILSILHTLLAAKDTSFLSPNVFW